MTNQKPTVDLDGPLLAQVGALGDDYDAWVHRSVKPAESLRIFRRDGLEAISHIPWWLVLVVWIPITTALLVFAVTWQGVPAGRAVWLMAAGVFLWTLIEYVLHRYVFHFRPRTDFGRRLHFLAHGVHHKDPWDRSRLVFPPLPAFLIALPIYLAIYAALSWTDAPLGTSMALMGGVLVGYIVYDMTHYYTHHAKPVSRLGKYLKRYHLAHHHRHPHGLYGVSSPLWDVVFRTGWPKA